MSDIACPDRSRLQEMLGGRLDDSEADELSRHVEACARCLKTLDQLAASSWEGKVRMLAGDETSANEHGAATPSEPVTEAEQSRVATNGDATDDEVLRSLSPSERPGSLGRLAHYEIQEEIGKGGFGV